MSLRFERSCSEAPSFPVEMAHRAIVFSGPYLAQVMAHMAHGID